MEKNNYPWKKLFIRKDCDIPTCCGVISTACDILWNYSKIKKEYLFIYFKDGNLNYYFQGLDEFAAARKVYKKYFFRPGQIQAACKDGLKFIKKTELKIKEYKKLLGKELSPENLLTALKEFKKEFKTVNFKYSILPWWALESWQHDFLDLVDRLIKRNKLEDQRDKILTSVLKPWKGTAVSEIQQKYLAGVNIEKLVCDYQFLRSWTVVWHKDITGDWIGGICEKNDKDDKESIYTKEEIVSLLKPSVNEKKYFAVASYIIYFKDWRDDFRRKHAYLWNFLFSGLAEYLGIEYDDIGYLTLDEIGKMLENRKIDQKIIESRKKYGCVITTAPKKLEIKILDHGQFARYLKIVADVGERENKLFIKGIVAQTGVVTGRVVVVRHYKDVFRVRQGDILVANTTHPNYLMGMKKAAAFITDEGGIASHAAIVAREMKKPCIVGTKVATKFLKEGDMVEVNTTLGIVRKLI